MVALMAGSWDDQKVDGMVERMGKRLADWTEILMVV